MKYVQLKTLVDAKGKPYSENEAKVIKELYRSVHLAVRSAMTEDELIAFDQNRDEADQRQEELILGICSNVASFFLLKSYHQQVGIDKAKCRCDLKPCRVD